MSTYTHYFGKTGGKKQLHGVSLRETFKGTNTKFLFFFLSLFNFLLVNVDLTQSEVRVLYDLEGTLNV